jgi:polysaccharide pyruvyl transferase CsaB
MGSDAQGTLRRSDNSTGNGVGTPVKRIVLSGYYGFNNSGDEAVLQSILLALRGQGEQQGLHIEPVVLSADPELTSRMYGVEARHRMRFADVRDAIASSDGLISGGGSLLQDKTSAKTIPYYLGVIKLAQWLGKPTFIYSQGIGPVQRRLFFSWIRGVFSKAKYVSVRDPESAELLARMGLHSPVEVVPDPVMGLPLKSGADASDGRAAVRAEGGSPLVGGAGNRAEDGSPLVGVSVRFWNEDRSELNGLAEVLRRLLEETEANVRFLPFHLPSDEEASEYIRERLPQNHAHRITVARGVTHPQDMLAEVARCDLMLGMRLHSLIYAASQRVPPVGVSYDPKIDQFLHRLGMKAAATTEQIPVDSVVRKCLELLQEGGKTAWQRGHEAAIDRLKLEAQLPAQQICTYFRSKG